MELNIFGNPLIPCCTNPATGYFRDGFCHTDKLDMGLHVVCSLITNDFLSFSKARGNDLSTPKPEFNFPGLNPGDRWCLCANRWLEAYEAGAAPHIIARATNIKALEIIEIEQIKEFAIDIL